ncbi:MAG: hypothetical protein VKJ06_08655 [Vampirovibrionales bacterium]|nr:hypothetical protein [Vampirovibrionales bacterium]
MMPLTPIFNRALALSLATGLALTLPVATLAQPTLAQPEASASQASSPASSPASSLAATTSETQAPANAIQAVQPATQTPNQAAKPEAAAAANLIKGSVVVSEDGGKAIPTVNEDDIKTVKPGSQLELTVSTEIGPGMGVSLGDGFYAKVSKHFKIGDEIVIPKGSVVHGSVTQLADPKRAGRNGYVSLKFDSLMTPDGREIPIDGDFSTKDGALKAAAKVVGRASGFTLGGGLVGALMVLRVGGLAAVTASQGYALAGGAAVGGAVGLTAAMVTKGKSVMIEPGTKLKVALGEGLSLPTMTMPEATADDIKLPGLDVKLMGLKIGPDPFGERREIMLTLDISNLTENTFSMFDIALEDENGVVHYPSPFGDTGLWFQRVKPNSRVTGNLTFTVDNPDLEHKLVFFKQYTRQKLAKLTIDEDQLAKPLATNAKGKTGAKS